MSDDFRKRGLSSMTGTGGLKRVPKDVLEKFIIPISPIEVQEEIVRELEQQQAIIKGNRQLIEIYTQKIQDRINKIWGN